MEENITAKFRKLIEAIASFATIIFITLRACEIIDWAWYWILSPALGIWIIDTLTLVYTGIEILILSLSLKILKIKENRKKWKNIT